MITQTQELSVESSGVDPAALQEQLTPFAKADCRACDGRGVYYGNVCVCHCVMDKLDAFGKLIDGYRSLYRAYVRLLEAGRDRIIDLGGSCDAVDAMERDDPYLIKARELLAGTEAA